MKGQKTGGRKKGTTNKATADIKAIASVYGPGAVKKLAEMAGLVKGKEAATSEQARVAAVKEILDRGYGKPNQPLEHGGGALEGLLDALSGSSGGSEKT